MSNYQQQRYLLMTLDPVHIGTGGYRLGRVDLTIVREPGTNVPKLPGTGFSGASRSYAACLYEKPDCAGKGGLAGEKYCDTLETCPICYTFGRTKGTISYAGTVSLFDAHILLFPVHSMAGPVWVGTKQRLEEAGFTVLLPTGGEEAPAQEEKIFLTWDWNKPLNLGWVLLDVAPGKVNVTPPTGSDWANQNQWKAIQNRIVLVDERLFSQIVNSNLEVRTSVSINPATGAAEEGALFTYEAIPRATFLYCDVVMDDYHQGLKPWSSGPVTKKYTPNGGDNKGASLGQTWNNPLDVVKTGLKMAEWLGIGGMGTRGFGRIRIVGEPWNVPLSITQEVQQ
ncbi:MAG: type III-B CRISPR module RAMP protein Cmr4 [candidate division KSB1 bacterium]|nr:type III-B CRISPR module RAMP protein Cmr4 [candidate division KSB1 bacterium]